MRPRLLATLLLTVPILACSGNSSSTDQPGPVQAGMGRGEVMDHTFSVRSGEFVRVFLAGGTVYRAELGGGGLRLELRPVASGTQAPLVEELVPGTGAAGTSIFSIRPKVDGEYELRTIGGDPTSPINVRLTAQPAKPRE